MAAQLLEDKLTCAICLELFQEPVTLPCGHNFCEACIRKSWGRCGKECPECRDPFPDGAELRRNVALSGVLEVGRPLELFCRTEGLCVCSACAVSECRPHELGLLDAERRGREVQLRARLEATRQQATQTETQLQELLQQSSQIQDSACNLACSVSGKFSSLLQALELRRHQELRTIKAAKAQVLAQARAGEQQLRGHLEALACHGRRIQDLLEQEDDRTFLQWDEDQMLGDLKELLSQLSGLLLEKWGHPETPATTTDSDPVAVPSAELSAGLCQCVPSAVILAGTGRLQADYRNLTFDPSSANHHFSLSCQNRQVKHCRQPQGLAKPGSFELWQVQCTQSFQSGRHYWEVCVSDHSVTLGVAYPGLTRHKPGPHTDNIGREPCSWGLCIQEDSAQAWHCGKAQRLPRVSAQLLGIDLDLTLGCLTFYSLEPETQRLHTFHALFTQPLYPVFWLLEGRTLTLCHQP
ncbi:Tripartite motif-containing protein 65 [Tupaia chinensis]|uniref:E3 ubiquitin-protein ligase TRIM65 n=1 Tax=Tupaia chinensis TaxID=246437 RepID=L9L017_TUPCH|nr:Tripartite motif-containing protein 65 [Tupaia chinensis]